MRNGDIPFKISLFGEKKFNYLLLPDPLESTFKGTCPQSGEGVGVDSPPARKADFF